MKRENGQTVNFKTPGRPCFQRHPGKIYSLRTSSRLFFYQVRRATRYVCRKFRMFQTRTPAYIDGTGLLWYSGRKAFRIWHIGVRISRNPAVPDLFRPFTLSSFDQQNDRRRLKVKSGSLPDMRRSVWSLINPSQIAFGFRKTLSCRMKTSVLSDSTHLCKK